MNKREQRMIIAKNIRDLVKSNKKTAKQVATDLNVSYSTFGDWTRARTTPGGAQLKDIADYFHVSIGNLTSIPDELINDVSDSEVLDSKVRIQIFEVEYKNGETINKSIRWEYIPKFLKGSDDAIGIMLSDNSMEPEYHKGDVIIARKVKYLNSDGYYVLESQEKDEWLSNYRFAKVINKGNQVLITPLNNDNDRQYVPERLNELEYMNKYKNKYSIIRLIRDYK